MGDKAINERVQACGETNWRRGSVRARPAGLATLSLQTGTRTEVIADQGGWARDSRALLGCILVDDTGEQEDQTS